MKLDILAVGAHPDDVELFAAGTLAKLSAAGYRTGIVDLTRGELGSRGSARIRAREAETAARHLGLAVRENLGLPDGRVSVDPKTRLALIRVLRRYRPGLVATHYWEDRHPDHVATSRLVAEASHHAGLVRIRTGQERFRPDAILYFKLPPDRPPTFVVDVSAFADARAAAIGAYRSQLFDPESLAPSTYLSAQDFLAQVESLHGYYGALIGRSLGEAFYVRRTLEVSDPIVFFREQGRAVWL
jgi:bacillithiol biosynthesis deacetylase BshB1